MDGAVLCADVQVWWDDAEVEFVDGGAPGSHGEEIRVDAVFFFEAADFALLVDHVGDSGHEAFLATGTMVVGIICGGGDFFVVAGALDAHAGHEGSVDDDLLGDELFIGALIAVLIPEEGIGGQLSPVLDVEGLAARELLDDLLGHIDAEKVASLANAVDEAAVVHDAVVIEVDAVPGHGLIIVAALTDADMVWILGRLGFTVIIGQDIVTGSLKQEDEIARCNIFTAATLEIINLAFEFLDAAPVVMINPYGMPHLVGCPAGLLEADCDINGLTLHRRGYLGEHKFLLVRHLDGLPRCRQHQLARTDR